MHQMTIDDAIAAGDAAIRRAADRAERTMPGFSRRASDHMGRVAALGCILCRHLGNGATPAEVHHIRDGQGAAQRASDWLTVPLCPEHHRGESGLHGLGRRGFERRYRLGELDLLAMTIEALYQ